MTAVPCSRFSTEMIESKYRRDAWIEGMAPMHDVSPLDRENADFKGAVESYDVGGLYFGSVTSDAYISDHRRSKHNRSGEHEFLYVAIYRKGGSWALHNGQPAQGMRNGVNIIDYSQDRRSVASSMIMESIVLPYTAVGYEPGKHAGSIIMPYNTAAGCMLSSLSAMVHERLPTASLKDAKAMAGMLTGMIRSLINGAADEVAREQAIMGRRAVMRQFVIDNIHDLNLNVATLCQKFGVSRATVFRDFEPGGLRHFIMIHRLNQALSDIAFGPAIRGRISLIAKKWGFSSAAHFSRTFRENFGFSPSDATGIGRKIGGRPQNIDHDYMNWRKASPFYAKSRGPERVERVHLNKSLAGAL